MSTVLGLDIGSNSIGWALIEDEQEKIIDMGVRVFAQGVNEINTEKEESRNAVRRMARQLRRQYERRRKRKATLKRLLRELGMMPLHDSELASFYAMPPYSLRCKALDTKLTPYELGRVLYHLNQRRGFKSSRKAASEEEATGTLYEGDAKSGKPGITMLKHQLQSGGGSFRTIGEYFHSLNPHQIRIRERYTERSMFIDEFNAIWQQQAQYYPEILTAEQKERIGKRCIFYQRPLASQKDKIGKCQFEKGKSRAPKSSPLFQRFRMLQQLNMLTIASPERIHEEEQKLRDRERALLLDYLSQHASLDLEKPNTLIKLLGLAKKVPYRCNLTKLLGLRTEISLSEALGREYYLNVPQQDKDRIYHTLQFAEDAHWIEDYAKRTWGMNEQQAHALGKIRFEDGYAQLSTKAIRAILPYMEQGYQYHEAMALAGYEHHAPNAQADGSAEFLPPINAKEIRNPIVTRALAQVRKVVNALIREYGKPDSIRIELARELKLPRSVREKTYKENREREKDHNAIRQRLLEELNIDNATREDIIRYRLWREAGEHCPFTGEYVSLRRLFFEDVDIEHILPYSRTLDDSFMNKTICLRYENAHVKRNRTPHEAYYGREQYDEIKERVRQFPAEKARRFTMNEQQFAERVGGDFIERQLNDTRYISRVALQYLQGVCAEVTVGNGRFTADLRSLWGLNSLLSPKEKTDITTGEILELKNRDDHRHHAVDAVVIACTTRSMLQRRSTWEGRNPNNRLAAGKRPRFDAPWQGIREQAREAVDAILVSHALNNKVRGQFHEASYYGLSRAPFTGEERMDSKGSRYVSIRKRLQSMNDTNAVYKICDDVVRATVIERLVEKGLSREALEQGKKLPIPKDAFAQPLSMPAAQGKRAPQIKSVRISSPASKVFPLKNAMYVEPGANYLYAIYAAPDKKGTLKQKGVIVSLFEAYARRRQGKEIATHHLGDGSVFICSLRTDELWLNNLHPDEVNLRDKAEYHRLSKHLYRVQKMTEGQVALRLHNVAVLDSKNEDGSYYTPGRLLAAPSTLKGFKVKINAIGKLERDQS